MINVSYVYVAIKTLTDLGSLPSAIAYCEKIAAQQGVDAMTYKLAAESLSDVYNRKVQS